MPAETSNQTVQKEWGGVADVAAILNCHPSTAKAWLARQRAAGKLGKLLRRFHLPSVRKLAIQASFEADT